MASPLQPSLPLPTASRGRNMSDAFRLRWLTTKTVAFKHFMHLRNQLHRGERGERLVATFGRDEQEISDDAGRGMLKIVKLLGA